MIKRFHLIIILSILTTISSQAKIIDLSITDAEAWRVSNMDQYVGDTVRFIQPVYIINNYYSNSPTVSVRYLYQPSNMCLPGTVELSKMATANEQSQATLSGINEYHRMGERIDGLVARINSYSNWQYISADSWWGNRDNFSTPPSVDNNDTHTLLICAWNLEYYLVDNLGTGFGPENKEEHIRQRRKILSALHLINADIYGFMEVEQGQSALKELSDSLGPDFTYIDDKTTAYSSFTKVGFVYDSTKVEPIGQLQNNNQFTTHRKKMITFREKSSGESFIFSLNHFKAKSGTGGGLDADQGDGQGIFNYTRTQEAKSVAEMYKTYSRKINENDLLLMGDLNAYAKEDPITLLTNEGMVDLHRAFHADSSYSYLWRGTRGYLDHALANRTMLKQITGMAAWHINSPEHDRYTYDNSYDITMFRSSDHDPILVGLRLTNQSTEEKNVVVNNASVLFENNTPIIFDAQGGWYRLYNVSGLLVSQGNIVDSEYKLADINSGFYILDVFIDGSRKQFKIIIR